MSRRFPSSRPNSKPRTWHRRNVRLSSLPFKGLIWFALMGDGLEHALAY